MTITTQLIENAIDSLGESFDSHDVIRRLAHDNQCKYVKALYEIENEKPFQTLHTALGLKIKEICSVRGFISTESRSKDIFGQNSKCLSWRKNK
jgi:hypothetical protein